jgi:hypothetical protein
MIDVQRTPEPPPSLALETWNAEDVRERLLADFFDKCYLTEVSLFDGGYRVDHRHPKGDGGDENDWWNLYPSHADANERRSKKWPEGGLLHPDGRDRVEERLIQQLLFDVDGTPCCFFAARDPADRAAVNTAAELDHLHNDLHLRARQLCDAVHRRLTLMLDLQIQVLGARRERNPNDPELKELELKFRRIISRRAPFTALLRSKVWPSLHDLFD